MECLCGNTLFNCKFVKVDVSNPPQSHMSIDTMTAPRLPKSKPKKAANNDSSIKENCKVRIIKHPRPYQSVKQLNMDS